MSTSSTSTTAVVTDGRPPLRATARCGALLAALALLCSLLVTVAATPAEAGTYRADGEVTYKEYWVPHSEFTGGCGDLEVPAGGTRWLEPWPCDKQLELALPDDFSQALRAEIYIDLWRNQYKHFARFQLNDGAVRQPDVGDNWSRTPYVSEIPLSELRQGANTITFSDGGGGYHVYDVAIRIYHDATHPLIAGAGSDVTPPVGQLGTITADNGDFPPSPGAILKVDSDTLRLSATATGAKHVEFHASYDGYDEDNDGDTSDWHANGRNNWHPGGTLEKAGGGTINHVGTATTAPYTVTWKLPHVANQSDVRFKIRVVDAAGNVREAAGGPSAAFTLARHDDVDAFGVPSFADTVLHHGGSKPQKATRYLDLPADLTGVKAAHLVGAYYQNPFIALNRNAEFVAFASGEDFWPLSVRQLQVSHLVPGTNRIDYRYNPAQAWGQFIEKPGPMIVLRRDPSGPARLVSEPRATTANEGAPATFQVEASGAGPLSYQWQRDGVDIAGATGATYTTPSTDLGDHGAVFRVRVSNAEGTVTSRDAVLTVRESESIASDDFTSPSLDPQVWTLVDPLGDSDLELTGTEAVLSVPEGVTHDLWAGANNAPRLVQHVPDTDFEVEAKLDSQVLQRYQGRGLVVEQDADTFMRIGVHSDGAATKLFVATMTGATPTTRHNKSISSAAPVWLRLARAGSTWTVRYSHDGQSWTTAVTFAHAIAVETVGVFALNVGSPAPAYDAVVDHFYDVAAPGPGDPPPDTSGPAITDVLVDSVAMDSAAISWVTDEPGSSVVAYGPTAAYEDGTVVDDVLTIEHRVTLDGLLCGTTYHYGLESVDALGNVGTAPDATFTTADCPVPDGQPPAISGLEVETTSTTATVGWSTDEPAASRVEYGLTSSYGEVTEDLALVTDHTVTLRGLACEATYHFRTVSTDVAENSTSSPDGTFTTATCTDDIKSDDFDEPVLDEAVWTWNDPLGDATLAFTGTDATLSVPAGAAHDLWTRTRHAPWLRQPAPNRDLDVVAKFQSTVAWRFQGQGIVVEESAGRFLRVEFHHDGTSPKLFVASVADGAATVRHNSAVPASTPTWLRVVRTGDAWEVRYSSDGQTWATATTFDHAMTVTGVGPYALNAGSPVPGHTAVVDSFYNAAEPGAGDPPPDSVAPAIADVAVEQVSSSSARVVWSTDEAGSSQVAHGPTAAYEDGTVGSETLVTAHAVELTGLECEATYHFAASSTDEAGNTGTAPDATFTTAACPPPDDVAPVISDVHVSADGALVTVSWTTDEPASSWVDVGASSQMELGTQGTEALTTDHVVELTGLACETDYHYRVRGTDASGNDANPTDGVLSTGACGQGLWSDDFVGAALDDELWSVIDPVGDASIEMTGTAVAVGVPAGKAHDLWANANNAPRLRQSVPDADLHAEAKFDSSVGARFQGQGILVEESATRFLRVEVHHDGTAPKVFVASVVEGTATVRHNAIVAGGAPAWLRLARAGDEWTVRYSLDGLSWTTAVTFTHPMTVSGIGPYALNAGSPTPAHTAVVDYFYNVAAPGPGDPPPDTAPPVITGVAAADMTGTSARIAWTTDEPATSRVSYGTTTAYEGGTVEQADLITDHDLAIQGLSCETSYHYRVESADAAGNTAASADATFTTGECVADDQPPVVSGVNVAAEQTSAVVSWSTDEPATSSVSYGTTSAYEGGTVDEHSLVFDHHIALEGLVCETTYHYRLGSTDAAGNAAGTDDATFSTTGCGTPAEDPPALSDVSVSDVTATTATVTWTTNVPSTSSVSYGTSSAYESGTVDDADLVTAHVVTLTGLAPETTYHYRASSALEGGETAIAPDAIFTTSAGSGPVIDLWYGDEQSFGSPGRTQEWVNLLGNVADDDGVTSLTFSLNGGAAQPLTVGPTYRRPYLPGDFNAEIAYADLAPGENTVVLTATDSTGQVSTKTATVISVVEDAPTLPYSTDWATATSLTERAQPVDGKWTLDSGTLRTVELGYDRTVAVGDVRWQDYEVTVPITVHAFGPGAYTHLSGPPLVGLGLRWNGHTAMDSTQPRWGFWPTGAFAWYVWHESKPRYELLGNNASPAKYATNSALELGRQFVFKARVETVADGTSYRFKAWPADTAEPATWSASIVEPDGPATGSVLLVAHHVDAAFGDITVAPLTAGGSGG